MMGGPNASMTTWGTLFITLTIPLLAARIRHSRSVLPSAGPIFFAQKILTTRSVTVQPKVLVPLQYVKACA